MEDNIVSHQDFAVGSFKPHAYDNRGITTVYVILKDVPYTEHLDRSTLIILREEGSLLAEDIIGIGIQYKPENPPQKGDTVKEFITLTSQDSLMGILRNFNILVPERIRDEMINLSIDLEE